MKDIDIKSLLPQALTEALSEEKLNKLQAEFTRLVESKVQERIDIAMECERTAFNENATAKLEQLIVKLDETHSKEFIKAYNTVLEDAANEIDKVKQYYAEKVQKESNKFKIQLVEAIDKHLTAQINKLIPTKALRKAMKNTTATQVLESMKALLAVDEAAAIESCRKPFMESIDTMNKQGKKIKMLEAKNAELNNQIAESAKQSFFNEKKKALHLNEDALNFVKKTIGGRDLAFIKENFDYTLKHYMNAQAREKEALTQKTMNERRKTRTQVARAQLVESKKPVVEKKVEQRPLNAHDANVKHIIGKIIG